MGIPTQRLGGSDPSHAVVRPASGRVPRGRSRLRGNVGWNLAGNLVYGVAQWAQIAIIARVAGPAGVGTYAYLMALTMPVMMLASLQARTLQASDARGEYTFGEYRRLRLATTGIAMAAIAVLGSASPDVRAAWPVLAAVCVLRAADALSDIYYGEWQRHERMWISGVGLALNGLSSVACVVAAAALGGGVAGAAAGSAVGSVLTLAVLAAVTARDLRRSARPEAPAVAWGRVGRLAWAAAPLGLIVVLASLQQNAPLYFVQHHAGAVASGLFAAAAQLTGAGMVVVSAVTAAALPRFAALCAAGDVHGFRRLVWRLVAFVLLLGAAGVGLSALVGRELLSILFGPRFGEASGILVVLSVATGLGFATSVLSYALTSARVIAAQPYVLAGTLAALGAATVALLPRVGAAGAAWGMVVGYVVQGVASAVLLLRFGAARAPAAGDPEVPAVRREAPAPAPETRA